VEDEKWEEGREDRQRKIRREEKSRKKGRNAPPPPPSLPTDAPTPRAHTPRSPHCTQLPRIESQGQVRGSRTSWARSSRGRHRVGGRVCGGDRGRDVGRGCGGRRDWGWERSANEKRGGERGGKEATNDKTRPVGPSITAAFPSSPSFGFDQTCAAREEEGEVSAGRESVRR
jgi:hypothetical protein